MTGFRWARTQASMAAPARRETKRPQWGMRKPSRPFARDPIANLTLWAGLVFLLDPLNYWLGRPSLWRDWHAGRFARTLAAFAGGLMCGFLWEFWNYWALTKWTYHLPFLGAAEHYRYFEMPLPGLLGFIPFGIECWIMWQLIRIPLDGLAEPLPDDKSLL